MKSSPQYDIRKFIWNPKFHILEAYDYYKFVDDDDGLLPSMITVKGDRNMVYFKCDGFIKIKTPFKNFWQYSPYYYTPYINQHNIEKIRIHIYEW